MNNSFDTIIQYDLSTNNAYDVLNIYVKQCMIEKGYLDRFTEKNSSKTVYLPINSLWKKGVTDIKAALNDLVDCISKFNNMQTPMTTYNVQRFSAFEFTSRWHAIFGEPYKIECFAPVKE